MEKLSLQSIKGKFGEFFDNDPEKIVIRPYRIWTIFVGVFFASIICGASIGYIMFIGVNQEKITDRNEITLERHRVIDVQALDEILQYYENKAERFKGLY